MCARYVGDNSQILFRYSSGLYANASGNGQWIGLVTEHNVGDNENVRQIRYLGGGNRNVDIHVKGALDHNGTITYHPQDWKFLFFTLGSNTDAGSPSPYTHVIKEVNSNSTNSYTSGTFNPFIDFNLEDSQTHADGQNFVRTVNGCNINSFELRASEGEIVTASVNYVAQSVDFSSGTATAVTASTSRPFLWEDVRVHIPSGTVFDEVNEVSVSVNNNADAPHYLNGSRVIAPPIMQNRDYNVSLGLDASTERTKTLYDQYFRGGSEFNMMLQVTDTDAGAGSRDLFWIFSGCRLSPMNAPSTNEGAQQQSLTIIPKNSIANVNDTTEKYGAW